MDHVLRIARSDGAERAIVLEPRTTADLYAELMVRLNELGVTPRIWTTPCEVENAIPFERDTEHAAYDPLYANRFWNVLRSSDRVMTEFRGRFLGKCSPVHFFWGSFDLAVTRFSGRPAPPHPGVPNAPDFVTREAYSHEVSSAGFWPGGGAMRDAIFYAYAYPSPDGFAERPVRPSAAAWSKEMGEFVLPYDAVRLADDPDAALTAFLESTYEAAADAAGWDRAALER